MASIASDHGILSELPYDIRQKILSCLTLRQRAIASLVSRNWRHMIASLDDHKLVQTNSTKINCGYCYRYYSYCRCSYRVKPVIKLAADNMSFTECYLFVRNSLFYMSTDMLESSLLTVLHLKGYCNMEYIGEIKEMSSLKEIYLDSVCISPDTFSKIINKCPSIVELTLIHCYGLYSISVPHLNQLKKVHVNCGSRYIQTIEIQARNMREFHLFSSLAAPKLDLRACTKLQVLKIDCEYIPFGFPQEISSVFPCLKSLFLRLCKRPKKFKLLSPELENLTLSDMVDLDDAIIVTPNLRSFKLIDMVKLPSSSSIVGSRLKEAEIELKYVYATSKLPGLRTFAENWGEILTFSLTVESKEVIFHSSNHGSNDIRPLCIKHINLDIHFYGASRYKSLVDELFSYFHPQTLLVRVNSDVLKHNFIQVLLDELVKGRKKCGKWYKYCKSNYMRWCYFLKDFKILESTARQGVNQFIRLEFQWC
ncbi:uncharacterized protein LOC132032197 [Lycium ferocissimum]|uniref:uncharacterized protein LOC132032197 n=1 Tax=Lycium ferocissimum TaxID=112874 RepID=UPI0028164E8E|nr:uncharacterized protein LOC132032197 [Lycium ferocissimum]